MLKIIYNSLGRFKEEFVAGMNLLNNYYEANRNVPPSEEDPINASLSSEPNPSRARVLGCALQEAARRIVINSFPG